MPQLATEWSWSADNLTLTMKLRPGVTFHDGEPFDAEAVKYNIERYQAARLLQAQDRGQADQERRGDRSADRGASTSPSPTRR